MPGKKKKTPKQVKVALSKEEQSIIGRKRFQGEDEDYSDESAFSDCKDEEEDIWGGGFYDDTYSEDE